MKLMRLPFVGEGTAAGSLLIRCCKCGSQKRYEEAARAGWSADLEGKPYSDYVCNVCAFAKTPK